MEYLTKILKPNELHKAAKLLQDGQCVAFPTETVYGLGANALNPQAVKGIFLAKGRPQDNPLIVHIHSLTVVEELVDGLSEQAELLMKKFWPGPLTLVLPKKNSVPHITTGGLDTVAVRMPNHRVALDLIRLANLPIAAPSANISGKPSPTVAQHVFKDLNGRIPAIVDGGPCGWGVESTVVDCTTDPVRLLRPGGITLEELEKHIPIVVDPGVNQETVEKPRSPGMKYRHYSPEAQVIVVVGDSIPEKIRELLAYYKTKHKQVGVMAFSENQSEYVGETLLDLGSITHLKTAASRMYALLRLGDELGLDLILVEGFPENHLGMAIMNRLKKAAGHYVVSS